MASEARAGELITVTLDRDALLALCSEPVGWSEIVITPDFDRGLDALRLALTGYDRLSYRERKMLELYDEGKTTEQIAQRFKVTPERIEVIAAHARSMLAGESEEPHTDE